MLNWTVSTLVIVSAFLGGSSALGAQKTVNITVAGQKVVGTLQTPSGGPAPVVLLLHGFTGSRDELGVNGTKEGVFSRTARVLEENGFASLRIDFRGSGQSDGKWADTTFSGQITDALAAVDWLKTQPQVNGKRMYLLGWSQGGLVASHVAQQRPEVRAVSLWAPVSDPLHTFSGLAGADAMAKGLSSPADTLISFKLPWGAETALKASFFQEMPLYSPPAALAQYKGPLQVIVGSKDPVVSPQPAAGQVLLKYHSGPEKLDLFEMDHAFNALTDATTLDQQVIPAMLGWFKAHP